VWVTYAGYVGDARQLGGFDREHPAESFGISPDGQWLTIAAWEQLFSIMATDALPFFNHE
jgi:hypothetical protein